MKKILSKLERKHIVYAIIIMALITQISHATHLFNSVSKLNFDLVGWLFAIALESSIFVFTIYQLKRTATMFAIISTVINLLYYWFKPGLSYEFVAMCVISPIIPLVIWNYSELITTLDRKKKYTTNKNKGKETE